MTRIWLFSIWEIVELFIVGMVVALVGAGAYYAVEFLGRSGDAHMRGLWQGMVMLIAMDWTREAGKRLVTRRERNRNPNDA